MKVQTNKVFVYIYILFIFVVDDVPEHETEGGECTGERQCQF